MSSNIIQIDDHVEMYLIRQMERERKTGERAHGYHSRITDIYEDGGIELYMPMEAGKAVLFPLRIRLSVLFDTQKGLYEAIGVVEERYRSNNRYMLRIGLKSQLYKYHRRGYCGLSCTMNMAYFAITPEQALKTPASQLQKFLNTQRKVQKQGIITELNGAGICFETDGENETNSYILVQFQQNLIPAYLLLSEASAADGRRYENKAEFIWNDSRIQEAFLRYIFDEKRKNRKKEV